MVMLGEQTGLQVLWLGKVCSFFLHGYRPKAFIPILLVAHQGLQCQYRCVSSFRKGCGILICSQSLQNSINTRVSDPYLLKATSDFQ